jgi:drug/metabolite transporter (DMT)-like permease
MLPAILTTFLWSVSVVCATRSSRYLGGAAANLARLILGMAFLAMWAHGFGKGLGGAGLSFFLLSGLVGFGLGDVALFEALPRIGSRLTLLLAQSLAAPIGALIEWLWLGTTLSMAQIIAGLVIIAGVSIALAPKNHLHLDRGQLLRGVAFGFLAAIGQAGGAVLSRKAYQLIGQADQHVDGGTAAYQRILGGVLVAAVYFVWLRSRATRSHGAPTRDWRKAWPWMMANALAGSVLGVSCYQWALATAPSGIVLSVVATLPLVVIPFSWRFEGDRPGLQSVIGGVIAVAGVIALTQVR